MTKARLLVKLVLACAVATVAMLGLSYVAAQAPEVSEASTGEGVHLLQSDAQSIVLELHTTAYDIDERSVDGVVYQVLRIPGYAQNDRGGHPQLPLQGTLLGIPPDADPVLRILETESELLPGRYSISPVPRPRIEYDLDSGQPVYGSTELVGDQTVYSVNAFYPEELARITSYGHVRDQRFLRLQLYPFQYNPVTQQLRFHKRLRVEIDFAYGRGAMPATRGGEIGGPFETVLKNSILNYESSTGWREKAPLPASLDAQGRDAGEEWYKIAVQEEGIYKLTRPELEAAGVFDDPSNLFKPQNFRMYNGGEEIAIFVRGEKDGFFHNRDFVLFYAEEVNTKYTDTNVYWFIVDDAPGKRMDQQSGEGGGTTPTWFENTEHIEENHKYIGIVPFDEAEHWYWEYLMPVPASKTYSMDLNNISTAEPYSATLRTQIAGLTSDDDVPLDHHALVYINDHPDPWEDAWWDGITLHTVDVDFPSSLLREGQNDITVVVPGDTGAFAEILLSDWFEIDYRDTHVAENDTLTFTEGRVGTTWQFEITNFSERKVEVYDVTDPSSVVRILTPPPTFVDPTYTLTFTQAVDSPARYLAQTEGQRKSVISIVKDDPSTLTGPNGADYVIITHSDLYDRSDPSDPVLAFADYRASQGLSAMVVDVEDIYDEFSYGLFDPRAIRDFLVHTYDNWDPAPSYVLLLGDGHFDFKDNLGSGEQNYVPPYLACVDPYLCEIPSDNRYACLSGEDNLADVFIGRLPVKTPGEAETVLGKILTYEAVPLDDWRRKALFVADDPDDAGDFDLVSNEVADHYLPASHIADKVYYRSLLEPGYSSPGDVTTAIVDAINEGRLLVNYFGHAFDQYWGHEQFFVEWLGYRQDLALLTNSEEFPVVVSMACRVGNFASPSLPGMDSSCLSESLVRADAKGAVASWASSGWGECSGHELLDQGFFTALFTDHVLEVGAATTQATWSLVSYQYLADQYVLLGDPATRLALQNYAFLPLALKQY